MWILAAIFDFLVDVVFGLETGAARAAYRDNRNDRGKLRKPSDKYVC